MGGEEGFGGKGGNQEKEKGKVTGYKCLEGKGRSGKQGKVKRKGLE